MELDEDRIRESNIISFLNCFENVNNTSKWKGLMKNCNQVLCEKSGAIRHLKRLHKTSYDLIQTLKINRNKQNEKVNNEIELRVSIDVKSIWDGCIKMITENGLPLSFVQSYGFKQIIEPYRVALALKGIRLNINRHNIKNAIEERASKIQNRVKFETKNAIISVLLDIATRHNRSVLGICIKYSFEHELFTRTIAMHTLRMSHTAENIYKMVIDALEKFNISIDQVYSVSSDNARNLTKTTRLMNEEAGRQCVLLIEMPENLEENVEHVNQCDMDCDDGFECDEDEEIDTDPDQISEDEENIDDDIFDEQYYSDLLNNVREEFNNIPYKSLIPRIACANHCIHLVLTHAIENCQQTAETLAKIRQLVKKLRTPTYRNLLFDSKLPVPKLDISVRWNSIYLMVCKLFKRPQIHSNLIYQRFFLQLFSSVAIKAFCITLKNKDNCGDIFQFLLSDEEWTDVDEIINILKPFYIATMKLQSENITLSDFFGIWISLKIQTIILGKNNSSFQTLISEILDKMKFYQESLLANPVILSAIYLDPRYQTILKPEQKKVAIEHLLFLNTRFEELQKRNNETNVNISEPAPERSSFEDIQSYISSLEQENIEAQNSTENNNLKSMLQAFDKKYPPKNLSFLDFWKQRPNEEKDLFRIALLVSIVSPTQNTVERGFSAFSVIFSPLRTKMGDNVLNNILIARLNPDLNS